MWCDREQGVEDDAFLGLSGNSSQSTSRLELLQSSFIPLFSYYPVTSQNSTQKVSFLSLCVSGKCLYSLLQVNLHLSQSTILNENHFHSKMLRFAPLSLAASTVTEIANSSLGKLSILPMRPGFLSGHG